MSNYPNSFNVKTFSSEGQVGNMTLVKLLDGTYELKEVVDATGKMSDGGWTDMDIDLNVQLGKWKVEFPELTPEARQEEIDSLEKRLAHIALLAHSAGKAMVQINAVLAEVTTQIAALRQ